LNKNISQFDLTDRTAIVTGGGQGIGKGICLALAQAGANIVVVDLNHSTAEATAREIEALGRKALAIRADVRNREQIEAMVRQAVEVFGNIDILVNNAGGIGPEHFVAAMEISELTWDDVINNNLKSVFLCSQAVAKSMIEQKKGTIVNIASVAAFVGHPFCVPYGVSKAGVVNLTQTMANILGPHNIRVNAVAPGSISTETREVIYALHPELARLRQEAIPLGRQGTIEEVAWVVAFLASDASAYISGQVIRIDGAALK
jgi:3-oxoacyl-[acyl-carrier protein] reductase